MPDLDQLDPRLGAAFEHIARDISGSSVPPGARTAIRTSRRRRGVLAGSVAVLALVAGGVAAGQLLPGEQSAGIAERGDDVASDARPLPEPEPFTAESFSDATDGWLGPWQGGEGRPLGPAAESCFEMALDAADLEWGDAIAEPKRIGNYDLSANPGGAAAMSFYVFRSTAAASVLQTAVRDSVDSCEPHSIASSYAYEGPGEGVAAVVESQGHVAATVVIQISDRVALGLLVTPGAVGIPDEAVLGRMADALAAGLQDDATYQHDLMASDEAAEGPNGEPPPLPSASAFAGVVDGWVTDWEPRGPAQEIDPAPCLEDGDWWYDVDQGSGGGFGTSGEATLGEWTSVPAAQDAWGVLNESLEQCESARWKVTPGPSSGPGTGSLWATYDGGTIFAARHDGTIVLLHLDRESNPPDDVAESVLDFLADDLASRT